MTTPDFRSRLRVLLVAASTVACTHMAPTPSIQARCGVDEESRVTRDQAVCIATLAGLAPGLEPWKVSERTYPEQGRTAWIVSNTLDPNFCALVTGQDMYIDQSGGALLVILPAIRICD